MNSSSATVRVDKATSDLLNGPDWALNMEICDLINTSHGQAKDVVKAVKKRLQNKNPKVQLLALTLLETIVKNGGDYVYVLITERNILQEMIKIARKNISGWHFQADMHVRDKILVLIDSWQEAFGGRGGKYPQYYWAYEELRCSGVKFPQRSSDTAPILTPPITQPTLRLTQAGFGMPSDTPRRLDEAMASETENLSSPNMDSMRSVMDLLTDMLQALNPNDQEAVKDEVIAELVNRCRSNQTKLMQMLNSTGDEELLGQGLALNDSLQSLLAKHDALASGSPLPAEVRDTKPTSTEERDSPSRPNEALDYSPQPYLSPSTPISSETSGQVEDEEEDDDDFAQLARRRTKYRPMRSEGTSADSGEGTSLLNLSDSTTLSAEALSPSPSNTLALPEPPAPVRITTKEQDMIDLLSISLSTTSNSPHQPQPAPPASDQNMHQVPVSPTPGTPYNQNMHQVPVSPTPGTPYNQNMHPLPMSSNTQGYPYGFQPYPGSQGQVSDNSYIVPWAQPQPQLQPQYPQYPSNYPPPPWATTPANSNHSPVSTAASNMTMTPHANAANLNMSLPVTRSLQYNYSLPARSNNVSTIQKEALATYSPRLAPPSSDHKAFVPTYRLFEELNVLGSADKGLKGTGSMSPSMSSTSGQGMVGGRK